MSATDGLQLYSLRALGKPIPGGDDIPLESRGHDRSISVDTASQDHVVGQKASSLSESEKI